MTISSLPDELIFNILSRLPVKSVVVSKAVCSSWHRITNTTRFPETHLNGAAQVIWGLVSDKRSQGKHGFFINDSDDNPTLESHENSPLFRRHSYSDVKASCNGLLIVKTFGERYTIRNPITREEVDILNTNSWVDICGFYFDELKKEYKLLMRESKLYRDKYFIYELSTKNTRPLQTFGDFNLPSSSGVVISGSLFWTTRRFIYDDNKMLKLHEIIMFNYHTENFVVKPHPTGKSEIEGLIKVKLWEIEGTLGYCNIYAKEVQVWILEDVKSWTWVKKYVVKLDGHIDDSVDDDDDWNAETNVVGIQNRNMLYRTSVGLLWYNLRKNKVQMINTELTVIIFPVSNIEAVLCP